MGGWRIRGLLELTPNPLPRCIKMPVKQIHFHELLDWPQAIRGKLRCFFQCLAGFAIPLGLAQREAKRHLGLWVVRRELCLLAYNYGGVVEPIKRPVCSCQ